MVAPVMGTVSKHWLWNGGRRSIAAGAALLVFVLGLLAVSPSLHERLHDGMDSTTGPDHCAVALLATGVCLAVPVTAPLPRVEAWAESAPVTWTQLSLESPRYLLRPERGPPQA
jgi:hypothetical protein